MNKRLIIVDISSFIFRAFYAVRPLHAPDGTPVNAVHGVLSMMLKLIEKYRPDHLFLARDSKEENFRHKLYDKYKANRDAPPEDLVPQFKLIENLIHKMNLPSFVLQGYEADDIIGSAVCQWKNSFDEILIATGDKDIMQFVDEKVKVLDTMKDKIYGPDEVFEKLGVRPNQVVDYLSMLGDTSDNIPGMKGIGAKGAAKLLEEFGTVEACVAAKDTFSNKRIKNAFENHLEDLKISKKLIEIVTDLDLKHTVEETELHFRPDQELISFLKGLGFKSSVKKLEDLAYKKSADPIPKATNSVNPNLENVSLDVSIIYNSNNLTPLLKKLEQINCVAVFTEYTNRDSIIESEIISVCLNLGEKSSYYLPFNHGQSNQPDFSDTVTVNLNEKLLLQVLKKVWCRSDLTVYGEDIKRDHVWLRAHDIRPSAKYFDITQAHYVVDVSRNHHLNSICQEYLDTELLELEKNQKDFSLVEVEAAAKYSGQRAASLFQLVAVLEKEIIEKDLNKVFYEIDQPLISVLEQMEYEGILINPPYLKELEKIFKKELATIQKKVDAVSKEPVNLNSPKQVGQLLFEELKLPVIKRTKTGISTDSEVLEELIARNLSDIPALILRNRELEKLISTYVSVLPNLVCQKTGRIHTTFNQHVAATGRLSSDNPNLQNIPVRTEDGKKVRKAFIASPGNLLLSADYSQVELRLLAHFSEDETMVKAFKADLDIHVQTAAEITGIALDQVTSTERSKAKAVNFGLMYGQSSFGLSRSLKISRNEAKDYITAYFERFNTVKAYLDSLKDLCEKKGFAETLYGRKRFLPNINSKNRTIKSVAERMAINAPIQGTAADIIKLAMISIQAELTKKKLKSKMLLQVHDELIFEVVENELVIMKKLVKEKMENVVSLKVPLKVDIGVGVNWFDLKK